MKKCQRGLTNRLFQISFHGCDFMNYEEKKVMLTYLPIFVSSSSSDGARLLRRHNVAIIPMCSVKQQTKSMISKNSKTPPTATAIREADVTGDAGITKSRPTIWSSQIQCDSSFTFNYFSLCVFLCECVAKSNQECVFFLFECICVGVFISFKTIRTEIKYCN